ncbi:hypothetical protein FEM48_Zijuj11G0001900 [Ziziphus jujuba var. spinosa]|uniref:Uncharacterized protein n=1 Tax=Ziziphus jujuba var. spinosa TaxID=714518 RepID=A0A978UFQ5_ZIZJJ|nr:hypothetical protein FEM48_Zijuj11G0001900 [Ziziphus jujuba var. spinosa]
MSVACEIWLALTWLLNQLPKLFPLDRSTDLRVLNDKAEESGRLFQFQKRSLQKQSAPRVVVLHPSADDQAVKGTAVYKDDNSGLDLSEFPQRFQGINHSHDDYAALANRNTDFNIMMLGLDGLLGPFCVGMGGLFRWTNLYDIIDRATLFTMLLADALNVLSYGYEYKTEWERQVGWTILVARRRFGHGITLQEWWRDEQFWFIVGTSFHAVVVLRGILITGTDKICLTSSTSKLTSDEDDDGNGHEFSDHHAIKWTFLMIPTTTIFMINSITMAVQSCSYTAMGQTDNFSACGHW